MTEAIAKYSGTADNGNLVDTTVRCVIDRHDSLVDQSMFCRGSSYPSHLRDSCTVFLQFLLLSVRRAFRKSA